MEMFFTLCAFFTSVMTFWFLHFKWKRRRLVKMMEQFDGPPVYPLLGNCLELAGSSRDVFRRSLELMAEYNKNPWRLWILHKPYVVLTDPANIQIVANKTLEKDSCYSFIAELMGDGIFTSKVEKWKRHRQILNAAFNPLLLSDYFLRIFNKQNEELVNKLNSNAASGQHFDLLPYVSVVSMNSISETAMGRDETFSDSTIQELVQAAIKLMSIISQRFYRPILQPSFIFSIYKRVMGYDRLFKLVRDYPLKILEQKRRQLMEQKANSVEPDDEQSRKTVKNFISILINSFEKSVLSVEEIRDEVITIIAAGGETTAVTNCFLLLMLAMRPQIQDEVYEEIYQVFGDSKRHPTSDDLNKLQFLEMCINETLRRFPIAPFIFRHAAEDIPIGDKSMKALLSTILRNYQFSTDVKMSDIDLDIDLIIRSIHGYNVKIERRREASAR